MPYFEYIAADSGGNIKKGEMEATDRPAVIDFLKSEDLLVVKVTEKSSPLGKKILFNKKISYLDKINLTGNLATMLKAGVNLTTALEIIATESTNRHFQIVLNDLKFDVENGKSLSEGLGHYPKDFDKIFVNMIQAGEASGKMEESLARLNIQLKKEYSLISKVKNALIYPAVLIGGVLGVLVLIITFVIPKLVTVFASSTLKIPITTRILFGLARIASYKPVLTIIVLIIFIGICVFLIRLSVVKRALNRALFRLPISNSLLKNIELVRFCRTTGSLLGSGIPIGEALDIAASGMNLPIYKNIVLDAKDKIIKGVSLANAFRGTEKYFPGLLVSVINVGEKTGQLDKLLQDLADFYEEQADNTLKTLSSLIEPILLVIVGLLIGGMAISIIIPIYQLIGTI
ncbi:MAG: Type secretion system protein, type pilus assembly protein PilC [Candidatus Berkelbacteria bacterium]|nr:Type secretion system protein, type pilus assembly protein PilC [Candidatus Berkelbacteria bacterium]